MRLRPRLICLALGCCAALALAAPQGIPALFPAAQARRARTLLGEIDEAHRARNLALKSAWNGLESIEDAERIAYALLQAEGVWSAPDASYAGPDEAHREFDAMEAAWIAARIGLVRGTVGAKGKEAVVQERLIVTKGSELGAMLAAASLGEKATAQAARELLGRMPEEAVYQPELSEFGKALSGAGKAGRALWLLALAQGSPDALATFVASRRAEVGALSGEAAQAADRLIALHAARHALLDATLLLSRPETLLAPLVREEHPDGGPADSPRLGPVLAPLLALEPARARRLLEAAPVFPGGVRTALSEFAQLAAFLGSLPEDARRLWARRAALSLGGMELLRTLAFPPGAPGFQVKGALAIESAAGELNRMKAALPAAESKGTAGADWELARAFLRRPELFAAAAEDSRYSTLYAEAGRQLTTLFAALDEELRRTMAGDPGIAALGRRLFGGIGPADSRIELLELGPGDAALRRVALSVRLRGADGTERILPLRPEAYGRMYARAFARIAGLSPPSDEAAARALLREYGQSLCLALPETGAGVRLALAAEYPGAGEKVESAQLRRIDLEIALFRLRELQR